jgi:thiol-disulfide isomerase/thioredoxin
MKRKSIANLLTVSLLLTLLAFSVNLLAACTGTNPTKPAATPDASTPSQPGQKEQITGWESLPINTTDLNGIKVTADSFSKNKLTVLNVWGTWCGPCVGELPELQKVSEAFADKDVQIVGVLQDGVNESGVADDKVIKNAQTLLEDAKAKYTVLLPDETLITKFIAQMQYFPTTFFLDSNGRLVDTVSGAMSSDEWSAMINEVLGKLSQ